MKIKLKYLLFLVLLMFPFYVFAAGDLTINTSSLNVAPGGVS